MVERSEVGPPISGLSWHQLALSTWFLWLMEAQKLEFKNIPKGINRKNWVKNIMSDFE